MTGFIIASGPCCICDKLITFNAERVPSFNGRPICRECVEKANVERVRKGLSAIVIYDDSYTEGPG